LSLYYNHEEQSMLKRIVLVLLLLSLVLPALAQDDDTPELAIERAMAAAEEVLGSRAPNFTFQLANTTTNSSLGCPLVTGTELPFPVTPVQVNLVYPDGIYVVLSSMSGQIVVLCDAKFGDDMTEQLITFTCKATPTASLPAYVAPNDDLEGVFTATGGTAYTVYGVSSDGDWYQIGQAGVGAGWLEAISLSLSPECTTAALPTMAISNPTITQNICYLTPVSRFSNLRATFSTESPRVARLFENQVYQVTARNTGGEWYYIQPAGWVRNDVVRTFGDCANTSVNDVLLGTGFAQGTGGELDSDASAILQQFACPVDFTGYLPPRISIGSATASIGASATPNAIRDFPSTNDSEAPRLGTIQPNRTLNRVIAGPVCNQAIVWWLVEVDGVVGWTAESNNNTGEYYLDSTSETAEATPETTQEAPDSLTVGESPVEAVIFNEDGSKLFTLSSEQGFGDATLDVLLIWDTATGAQVARIEEPTGILSVDYAFQRGLLMVAAGNGNVTAYDATTFEAFANREAIIPVPENAQARISPDGSFIVIATCTDDSCESSQLKAYLMLDGSEIGSSLLAGSPVTDLLLSPDGSRAVVLSQTGLETFSLPNLQPQATWENSDAFTIADMVINGNGSQALLSGCNDADCTAGRVSLIDTSSMDVLGVVESHRSSAAWIAYKPDFTRFITADTATEIIERSSTTGTETQSLALGSGTVSSIAYSPDGLRLAVGTSEGSVQFFDLEQ
jgi:hypothetical protein